MGLCKMMKLLIGNAYVQKYVQLLLSSHSSLHRYVSSLQPSVVKTAVHNLQPGNQVLIEYKDKSLQPKWRGLATFLLTTQTALKSDQSNHWIHFTRVKKAPSRDSIGSKDLDYSVEPLEEFKLFKYTK